MQTHTGDDQRELTIEAIVALSGCAYSTVSARVAGWYARQDGSVPTVRRSPQRGTSRWVYLVDRDSYEAWVLNQLKPHQIPRCASEQARLLGCDCEWFEVEGQPRVMVAASCPVHGEWVKAS